MAQSRESSGQAGLAAGLSAAPEPIRLRDVVKRFPGGVVACDHVNLDIRPGEVLALLGENGSGKTTLMNILSGLMQPTAGRILVGSLPVVMRSTRVAARYGIGMVHQHFMLVQPLTVAENVALGHEPPGLFLDRPALARRVQETAESFGLDLDPWARVGDLPVGLQQRVEIVKALYRGARVLILDEPTAVLTPQEADTLIAIVRRMAAQGRSVVFISHKLREVREVADRIVVLRRGALVGEVGPRTSPTELAALMVGRAIMLHPERPPSVHGEAELELVDVVVQGQPGLMNVSLTVHKGEILGVAGVDGNGQLELEELLSGLRPLSGGTVRIGNRAATDLSPRALVRAGVARIPSDRHRLGIVGAASIADNVRLAQHRDPPFCRHGVLDPREASAFAQRLIREYDIRATGPRQRVDTLSGGNQQKLVVARELSRGGRVLVAAQPTRGVDVGATEFVYQQLLRMRALGMAILLISADLDEVVALSDRIGVLYRGRLVGITDQPDRERLGLWMAGVTEKDGRT